MAPARITPSTKTTALPSQRKRPRPRRLDYPPPQFEYGCSLPLIFRSVYLCSVMLKGAFYFSFSFAIIPNRHEDPALTNILYPYYRLETTADALRAGGAGRLRITHSATARLITQPTPISSALLTHSACRQSSPRPLGSAPGCLHPDRSHSRASSTRAAFSRSRAGSRQS